MILRKYKRLESFSFLLVIVTAATCSKPPCECDFVPAQFIECRIVNQQGKNLTTGSAAIYIIDSIQILKNENNFSINNASVRKSPDDSSSLIFDFYIPASRSFIYYKYQAKADTLDITWIEKTGKCCGTPSTYNAVGQLSFNGVLLQSTNGIYYFVR